MLTRNAPILVYSIVLRPFSLLSKYASWSVGPVGVCWTSVLCLRYAKELKLG
jgi:hypothetical protein